MLQRLRQTIDAFRADDPDERRAEGGVTEIPAHDGLDPDEREERPPSNPALLLIRAALTALLVAYGVGPLVDKALTPPENVSTLFKIGSWVAIYWAITHVQEYLAQSVSGRLNRFLWRLDPMFGRRIARTRQALLGGDYEHREQEG